MPLATDLFTLHLAANGEQQQHCKLCHVKYVWKKRSGSGTLRQHYESHHPVAFRKWQLQQRTPGDTSAAAADDLDEMQSVASSATAPSPLQKRGASASTSASSSGSGSFATPEPKRSKLTQFTLSQSFLPSTNAVVAKQMALFFATNHISHHIADSDTFRAFCDALRSSTVSLPSRKSLKASISKLSDEMREQLWGRLRSSQAPIALAIDCWTNVRQTKVTNLVLICGGVAFYWCSIANPLERNTAAWLFGEIEPKLQELVAAGVRFAAFIADNEAVNNALFDLLTEPFPFLVRVPCAAHTIQLVVKGAMQCERWSKVRAKVDEILRGFAASKEARLRLRALQQGEVQEHCLVKPNDTRWSSHMRAGERLLLLRRFVDIVFEQAPSFWSELEAYVAFLKPFQVATDVVQRDSSTLFNVFQQWSQLTKHITQTADARLKRESLAALKERWQAQVNTSATIACALLSLDADLTALQIEPEIIEDARRFIISFGCNYLRFFRLSPLPSDELHGKLRIQLG
jgi:hypothetical protein